MKERKAELPEGSYTASLFSGGTDRILKKLGEESAELIIAGKNRNSSEVVYEAADLVYHLLVMLADAGVDAGSVYEELASRRK
ncbi:MAG: phosphoribosyl-ATP diphosphatase [Bacillota bacterium]